MITTLLTTTLLTAGLTGCSSQDNQQKEQQAQNQQAHKTHQTQHHQAGTKNKTAELSKQDIQNASYTVGYQLGNQVNQSMKGFSDDFSLSMKKITSGFDAGISGQDPKISKSDIEKNMQQFQKMAQKAMQQKQKQQMQQKMQSVLSHQDALLNDSKTPTTGDQNANVAVIEFFDYQCAFCSKIAPEMESVIKNNPNVTYVFKEFPIFGQRWEASNYAAKMGLAIYQLGGSDAYIKYHNGIFATEKDEGDLTKKDVDQVAKQSGVDFDKAKSMVDTDAIETQLANNMDLGLKDLDLHGTPMIIIMPKSGANQDNTTIIPGYTQQKTISQAIQKAKDGCDDGQCSVDQ